LFGLRAFPETLRMFDLRAVRWVVVVSQNHPSVEDTISEAQYLSLPHIFGWPSGHTLPLEEMVRRLTNADIGVRATTPGLLEIPFLMEGTELIATLPEHLAKTLAKVAPVKVLPLPFNTPETREVVIWHKRNEPDPGHAWMREVVIAAAREI
jgi:DNA-binding transcriptional LysR family regulator